MITLKGTVGAGGKYLVSAMPVNTETHAVLKIAFENNTAGTNVALCAGTPDQFSAGTSTIRLSSSGGPGFRFLTIVDTRKLSGLALYVLREVGSADSEFTLTVE
jgi:hypothetical protein